MTGIQLAIQAVEADTSLEAWRQHLLDRGFTEFTPGEFISQELAEENNMSTRFRNGVRQPALSKGAVEKLLCWCGQRTKQTTSGNTTHEVTIRSLEALLDSGPRRTRKPIEWAEDGDQEQDALTLTERQAQMLHLITRNRNLINPNQAANRKLIDGLIELGVLSAWREITPDGERALKHFTAQAQE